jgi:hypothetical protein
VRHEGRHGDQPRFVPGAQVRRRGAGEAEKGEGDRVVAAREAGVVQRRDGRAIGEAGVRNQRVEAATQRVRELGDQVAEQARKNGLAWLEGYETILKNMLDLEEQAAKGTGAEWAATLATTHANFVRETSQMFLGAFKDQLKS